MIFLRLFGLSRPDDTLRKSDRDVSDSIEENRKVRETVVQAAEEARDRTDRAIAVSEEAVRLARRR